MQISKANPTVVVGYRVFGWGWEDRDPSPPLVFVLGEARVDLCLLEGGLIMTVSTCEVLVHIGSIGVQDIFGNKTCHAILGGGKTNSRLAGFGVQFR